MAEAHPVKMANYLSQKLNVTMENDLLSAPSTWKDVNTADSMLRRSLNLDKPQTNVQVNLWDREGYAQSSRSDSEKDEWGE